ncbi:MAG: peptidoglycan DD-metalloendopeptidase family protein [Faecousia sp.]
MSDNKHTGRGFSGKGYYIALILCAAAIGITSYVYYRNSQKIEEVSLQETQAEDILVGTMGTEDVPVLATEAPTQSTVPSTQATVPAVTEKKPLKTTSPVSGDTISGYSMEALSYNQTTRDWRVHNGVDIAAEPGTEVCAAADGKVYTVYEDDAMGYTVVIRHDDGYTTKYSSLSENVTVKAGDTVTMGQVIGYADDTAIVETTLGSHVHFSVTCNDAPMDPAEFLALGE